MIKAIMFFLFLSVTLPISAQIDPKRIDSLNCDDYLQTLVCVLAWDTLGQRGIKLLATETLLSYHCDFKGRPIADVVQYYGLPDQEYEWLGQRRKENRAFTYEYKLYTSKYGDRHTLGDKWLKVTTNSKRIVTKFYIYTVSE